MNATEPWGDHLVYGALLVLPVASGGLLLWLARFSRRQRRRKSFAVTLLANLLVLTLLVSFLLAVAETWYRFGVDTTDAGP